MLRGPLLRKAQVEVVLLIAGIHFLVREILTCSCRRCLHHKIALPFFTMATEASPFTTHNPNTEDIPPAIYSQWLLRRSVVLRKSATTMLGNSAMILVKGNIIFTETSAKVGAGVPWEHQEGRCILRQQLRHQGIVHPQVIVPSFKGRTPRLLLAIILLDRPKTPCDAATITIVCPRTKGKHPAIYHLSSCPQRSARKLRAHRVEKKF
jgi:hypothetical protein